MALDSTDSELKRTFLMDDSNGDSNLMVCSSASTDCFEEDYEASSECITEAEDDRTSSSLLEVANSVKVLEIFDAILRTSQLIDSSEPENTKEMNKINLCKNSTQDNAFIKSAEFITEAEDDCTSSSLLELSNSARVLEIFDTILKTSQLVDSSEPENTKEMEKINLSKSLAQGNTFIKSAECITEAEDDCTSSNLLELSNSDKVLEIFDAILKTSQLVDSSEPENTKEMDKINLSKSLAQDNTFIKRAECITEVEDDCTSSSLLELSNSAKVLEIFDAILKTSQLVDSSEPENTEEMDKINLSKSLAQDNTFTKSAECITEAEDDCTSSSLLELSNSAKVLEIFDAILETSQLVDSSEPENTEEMDKINLSKSLAQDNTFIKSAECITEAEDDCTSSSLLELSNSAKVLEIFDAILKTSQLVDSSEPENIKEMDKINLSQSLAQDNTFIKSAECIPEADDDCTSSSLLELSNSVKVLEPAFIKSAGCILEADDNLTSSNLQEGAIIEKVLERIDVSHNDETPQLFVNSEPGSSKEINKIKLLISLASNNAFITSAAEDNDCTSSNPTEVANFEKVLEINDVSHNKQTVQLVESSGPESTEEIGKINLCKSLVLNNAFITSEECTTESEDDCTSFNLLEVGNIETVMETTDVSHNEQIPQLVESSEPESTREIDLINFHQTLAPDNAFTECITEAEDDCRGFSLLEVGNIDEVLEISDVIHNEQTPQLVESSKLETIKEIDLINFHKSLAPDNAFAECITKAEDDCTNFNLQDVGYIEKVFEITVVSHNEQTPQLVNSSGFKSNFENVLEITDVSHGEQTHQLVESSETKSTTKMDKIHLCQNLAHDAFITEACIIDKVLEITNVSHIEQTPQLVESSELECTNEIVTSAECVTESENDCTSSNLLELANVDVSKVTDVSHNELMPQFVKYPEPGSTREVDKIDMHKCLAGDDTFNKSAEFIIEAKDDCKTSNLVEVAISEKMMGITDVSHNEQTTQLVESFEPESTREIGKINLSKSLVPDNTFFKSADCISEAKEDCTSSNLLEIANIEVMKITDVSHKNETLQLVESSELESSRKNRKIDMRKSLAWDSAFLTNAECIFEAKDDCTSSILLEVADIEKVPEITDVLHREQTSQLAESSRPESRRKVSKVDLRKSLAWDSAFFTSAECILDAEDDFSSSNLIEGSHLEKVPEMTGVSHYEQTPQLVESSEPEGSRKTSKINLRKSLAWNNAFFTSAGVLDAQEMSIMIDGTDRGKTPALPGIEEDVRGSMDTISTLDSDSLTLESLEADLFLDVRASIQKSSKVSNMGSSSLKAASEEKIVKGICASKKTCLPLKNMMRTKPTSKKEAIPGPDRATKQTPSIAASKRVSIDAGRVKSGSGTVKAALSSNYGVPTKVMPKSTLLSSKSTVLAPPPAKKGHPGSSSGLDTTGRAPLRKKLEPKRFIPASSSTLHKTPSMAVAATLKKGQSSRDTTGHLPSSKLSSSISPASSISEWSTDSSISISTSEFQENPTQLPLVNEQLSVKPSGLRMPSPKIGFFDGAKTAATTSLQPSTQAGLRRFSGRTTAGANVGSMSKAMSSSSQKASVVPTQTGKNMLNKNASKSTSLLKEGKLSIDSNRISNEANVRRENQIEDSNRKLTNLNLKSLERPPFSLKNTSTFTDNENSPFFRGS